MATNYMISPNMNQGLTGWVASSTTGSVSLSVTSDGGKFVSSSGTGRKMVATLDNAMPVGAEPVIPDMLIKRNTSTSHMPDYIRFRGDAASDHKLFSATNYDEWVHYWARIKGPAKISNPYTVEIRFPDNVPINVTITQMHTYNRFDSGIDYGDENLTDSNDVGFSVSIPSNSLTATLNYVDNTSSGANEQVYDLRFRYEPQPSGTAGAYVSSPRSGPGLGPASVTVPAAGRYKFRSQNFDWNGSSTPVWVNSGTLLSSAIYTLPTGTFTADFTATNTFKTLTVDASPSVYPTQDPPTYTWNWGDGTSNTVTTSKVTEHTYVNAGAYTVTLTTSTAATLRSSVKTRTVTVTELPVISFVTAKDGLTATFIPSKQDAASYLWDFGDGSATSSLMSPTHTYDTSDTYQVSLTITGPQSVTQDVTVSDSPTALDSLYDVIRVEVGAEPTGPYNRLSNPSGELSTAGWLTPVTGSYMVSSTTATNTLDHGVPGAKLIYVSSGGVGQNFQTESVPATAGQYCAAQWVVPWMDTGYFYRVKVQAIDAAGAVIGTGTQTTYLQGTGGTARTTPYLLPAGTVKARIWFDFYSNNTGGVAGAGKVMQVRNVMLATAAASGDLTSLPFSERQNWINVTGSSTDVSLTKEELQVGTLSCIIRDSAYDPATNAAIKPGLPVRFRVADIDEGGNTFWRSIFTGNLLKADTNYLGNKGGDVDPKNTIITLEATNNITKLAQTKESRGVATIPLLAGLLEPTGIPFELNGSTAQTAAVTTIASNDSASLLDQIAIVRDSSLGYAFVNKDNVLIVRDPAHFPTTPVTTIDESAYSAVDATYSTDRCINSVTIKWLRYNATTLETEEVLYGPYVNQTSIDIYGVQAAEYTMQGATENSTSIANTATAILNANSVPVKTINSVRIPIKFREDLSEQRALLDPYDLVTLSYEGTDTDVLVTSIKHSITPRGWYMDLEFIPDGTVASPQLTPPPPAPSLETGTTSTIGDIVTAASGWSFTSGNVWVRDKVMHLRLNFNRSGAAISLPVDGNMSNTVIGQLNVPYRPGIGFDQGGLAAGLTGRAHSVVCGSDGTLTLSTIMVDIRDSLSGGTIASGETFSVLGTLGLA